MELPMRRSLLGIGLLVVGVALVAAAESDQAPPPRRAMIGLPFAKQDRVDLFIAASAVWEAKADDPRQWEPTMKLARRLIERAEMKGERKPNGYVYRAFTEYLQHNVPRLTRTDELYKRPDVLRNECIQAPGIVSPAGFLNGVIISRGNVETERAIQNSVILANGNVTAVSGIVDSVVICDGDVTLTKRFLYRSLIVARGDIFIKQGATQSVMYAGGKVRLEKERNTKGNLFNEVNENMSKTAGFVIFFELSTVGLEVKAAKDVVQVSAVGKDKAFAKAGVQVGDTILTVEGKKPDSAEWLRRLLRDALAIGDATITLRRGEKTETVKVSLPE